MPGTTDDLVPIIRVFGVTNKGYSVCLHIHGFAPYFYVPAPSGFVESHISLFREALNQSLKREVKQKDLVALQHMVLAVRLEMKESIYGFHDNRKLPFIRITLALPRLIAPAKRILENGFAFSNYSMQSYSIFESNIDFEVRFMVDIGMMGCCWVEVPKGQYLLRLDDPSSSRCENQTPTDSLAYAGPKISPQPKQTRCQIELDIAWDSLQAHPSEKAEWSHIAPIRVLSFDIECAGRKGSHNFTLLMILFKIKLSYYNLYFVVIQNLM
ncbi:unnamed protein product [Protopolystoma xenopodis]|uniref:DNA polymerase delta catalytic subunit n=1 Tax=Protopolystoma xenopodis TaxID=117903 RepID=A0A448X423_9PLAT|nr:unnamed protein product [Protopolystoma xenopodis]